MLRFLRYFATLFAVPAFMFAASGEARAASWSKGYNNNPTIAHNFTPALGTNIVTIAPLFWYSNTTLNQVIDVLTTKTATGGFNLEQYIPSVNSAWITTGQYYQGIIENNINGLVGWNTNGVLYSNGTEEGTGVSSFAG